MKKIGKKKSLYLIGIIAVFLLCGIAGFCIGLILPPQQAEDADTDTEGKNVVSQSSLNTITYEGQKYRYNTSLLNILFLGIDNSQGIGEGNLPGDAGQSDCIMILSLDKETKEGRILQIPRDTITEVDIYDANGNYYTSVQEQIATQYSYAAGGASSCWAVKKTVSELLYDIPIDAYLALDMESVPIINDAVGGVTLTVPEDYTDIDPAFEKGAVVALNGEQAYKYIRYRDIGEDFSNQERMQRQLQYIPALITAVRDKVGENGNYYKTFFPLVEKYMVTDLREDQINELADYDLAISETQILPGQGKKGEIYEEFYVNEEKMMKYLMKKFYFLIE